MKRILFLLLLLAPAFCRAQLPGFSAPASTDTAFSTAGARGLLMSSERGPWVIGEVRLLGNQTLSEYALSSRIRARRGMLYTPSDLATDLRELQGVAGVLSARADLFSMPGDPVPESYASISISTAMVRFVFTIEEKPLILPGLVPGATVQAKAGEKKAEALPTSLSGVVLTPTAYRGRGQFNRPGLGFDINAAYYIGRLYGKNSFDNYTTRRTNYIDRIGQWLLCADGKMQVQSEGDLAPAVAAGVLGIFSFRDAPQPSPTSSFSFTAQVSGEKRAQALAGAYVVGSKNVGGARTSLGVMQGNAPNVVGLLSEYLDPVILSIITRPEGSQQPGQTKAASKTMPFASVLYMVRPNRPLALEFMKPNGMPLSPWLINFKVGTFLKLNFDLAFLKFRGGYDLLGTFNFRYTEFPR
jgi:hypothetical protein